MSTRFNEKVVHDVKKHFKQIETFQYTHFTFVKGEAMLRILRTNPSEATFEEIIIQIKKNAWWTEATHTIRKKNCCQK